MLYSCTHMATVSVKGLKTDVRPTCERPKRPKTEVSETEVTASVVAVDEVVVSTLTASCSALGGRVGTDVVRITQVSQ